MANNPPAESEDESEIEGILQSKEKIQDQIAELDATNNDREKELAQAIAADLSRSPVNIDVVVAKRATEAKTATDAFTEKRRAYTTVFDILDNQVKELVKNPPAGLKKLLENRRDELKKRRDDEINELEGLIGQIK